METTMRSQIPQKRGVVMLDLTPNYFIIPGVDQGLLEAHFKYLRNRVLENKGEYYSYAASVYLKDAFIYVSERIPNTDPIKVQPILPYSASADDLLNKRVTISGPEGFFNVIVSEKPFKSSEDNIHVSVQKLTESLLPNHIVGLEGDFLYIDGQVVNIEDFSDRGVVVIRCATLNIEDIDTKELSNNLIQEMIKNFSYR